jgi:DNA-directed RNA polymerase specialized sigma24 family protein
MKSKPNQGARTDGEGKKMGKERGAKFEAELARVENAYKALPRMDSPEFIAHIRKTSAAEMPPQVLARAFRQLPVGSEAANAVLIRLIGEDDQTGYLAPVWTLARMKLSKRRDLEVRDLVQATRVRILETLGDEEKGKGSETWWVAYARQCFFDAFREEYGRDGQRDGSEFARATTDPETGEINDPMEVDAAVTRPTHGNGVPIDYDRVMAVLQQAVDETVNTEVRRVAQRMISTDPYTKSALARELGMTRWVLEPLLMSARERLKAVLEIEMPQVDTSFLDDDKS